MPAELKQNAEQKAQIIVSACVRNRMNSQLAANELGVSRQAIQQQLKKPIVQKTLAEYLNKKFPAKYIQRKFTEGLEAKKVVGYLNNKVDGVEKTSDDFVEVDDLHCRHKYLVTLLQCEGHLRPDGNNLNVAVAINNYSNITDEEIINTARERKLNIPAEITRRIESPDRS